MDKAELIQNILNSSRLEQLAPGKDPMEAFRDIAKLIHPDVCTLNGADEAFRHLFSLKKKFTDGEEFEDDRGLLRVFGNKIIFGDVDELYMQSVSAFHQLKAKAPDHIKNYMPEKMENGVVYLRDRSVMLSGLQLEQHHAMWILSRLLEFAALLEEAGFVHMGLCPETVMIIPDGPMGHGIQVISYYHTLKKGNKVSTISGKYQTWYPEQLFREKRASKDIDVEMAKRICLTLMGDNGTGVRLRKTHSPYLLDFILQRHSSAREAFIEYRRMIDTYFEKKYHHLNI